MPKANKMERLRRICVEFQSYSSIDSVGFRTAKSERTCVDVFRNAAALVDPEAKRNLIKCLVVCR